MPRTQDVDPEEWLAKAPSDLKKDFGQIVDAFDITKYPKLGPSLLADFQNGEGREKLTRIEGAAMGLKPEHPKVQRRVDRLMLTRNPDFLKLDKKSQDW